MGLFTSIRRALDTWWRRRRLNNLLKRTRGYEMSPAEREAQRRSFAFGNVKISNPAVTMEMVNEAADRLRKRNA